MGRKLNPKRHSKQHLTSDAWMNLSDYEKKRLENVQKNYELLKSMGISPKLPKFMAAKNRKPRKKQLPSNEKLPKSKHQFTDVPTRKANFKLFAVPGQPAERSRKCKNVSVDVALITRKVFSSTESEVSATAISLRNVDRKEFAQTLLSFSLNALNILEREVEGCVTSVDLEEETAMPERHYPMRHVKRKRFQEDACSEDELLHCDRCDDDYKGACPVHGPMLQVCDTKVRRNDPERAQHTLPYFLSVGISNIPRAGLGVWSEIPLTPGMVFGPYEGAIVRKGAEAEKSGYAWQVRKGSKAHHYIEAKSKGSSNWMRYVNCADRKEFQNVAAFQFQGDIYYKTVKPVLPYTEILVWYGDEYASALGVDVKEKRNAESPRPIEGFGCDVCSAFFSSSEALERHRSQHPYMQPDLLHRCPRCSYSTNFQHSLINHLLMHSGDKPHACPHCSKKFTTRQNLRSHLLLHTGQKEFICSTCGKGFAQMGNLRTHERVHSGERPYRCSHCGKDFTQLGSLERHRKLHTRQKPYPCPHCEYRFNDSTNLRRHITSKHTKVFPHLCPCCGKGFTRQRELKNHVVKHHHSEPAELYVPDHDVKHHHSEPAELCVPDHAVKHHHSGDTEICVPDHADIHHHQKPAEAILAESR